ncbi:hypothetical protein, partial [Escherichia coli]|uniref:hypothetical protein n=1 Tax=Escherichia coli TaxID=562 RepID=UPI001ABD1BD2
LTTSPPGALHGGHRIAYALATFVKASSHWLVRNVHMVKRVMSHSGNESGPQIDISIEPL